MVTSTFTVGLTDHIQRISCTSERVLTESDHENAHAVASNGPVMLCQYLEYTWLPTNARSDHNLRCVACGRWNRP